MRISLLFLTLTAGCLNAPVYRTARTLPARGVDLGLTVSATRFTYVVTETDQTSGQTRELRESAVIPNLVPEGNAHYGITNDFEIGGRVALSSLMLELDAKLRLIGDDQSPLHIAIAPAVGYRALVIIEGVHANLPLILTYDLNPEIALNVAPYLGYLGYSSTLEDSQGNDPLDNFASRSLLAGGSLGLQFRFGQGYLMPSLDFSRRIVRLEGQADLSGGAESYIVFSISLGALINRERAPQP